MKIIFMGTPGFAVPSLTKLIESQHQVIAVYTKEPKPQGRGYATNKSQVHQLADLHNLKVLTPKNFKAQHDVDEFRSLGADLAVVAAYGLILPETILTAPKYGCINIHPSLLPRWRGAAPLQHTILSGDKESAVCIMQMDQGLDTGDILLQENFVVSDDMTAYQLHNFTADLGADMVLKTIELIENQALQPRKQAEEGLTYAHKLTKDNERINWQNSAENINCQIRTFTTKPGTYFLYAGEIFKILAAEVVKLKHDAKPGTILDDDLLIACNGDAIRPTLLQREGRKMLYREAFLRGFTMLKSAVVLD
jgi:methionyl-tRNA formyltransferase